MTHAPRTSAIARHQHGEFAAWGRTDYLLADIFDVLRVANWQRTVDGSKGINQPAPYPRPGSTADGTPATERRFGSDPIPASEFYDWFYDTPDDESEDA